MRVNSFSIYSIIKRNAKVMPGHVAFTWENEDTTFRQFKAKVNRLARGLTDNGIREGDRIAVFAKNSLEYFLIYGAAAQTGAIVVPINWRLGVDEIEYIMRDTTPRITVSDPETEAVIRDMVFELPFVEQSYLISGSEGESQFLPFEDLMRVDRNSDECRVLSDDPFVIIHTAAVTGRPRGAVLTHENMISTNMEYLVAMGINPSDVHLAFLPLYHIACLGMSLAVFHAGGKNIVMPKFDRQLAVESIERDNVTLIVDFPPILANILEEAETSSRDLSGLRWVMGIDQPNVIAAFEKKTGGRFGLGYGQTEVSGLVSFDQASEKPGSVGRPGYRIEINLVDESDKEVKTGEVGEIAVRGPAVFKGFWNLEKETEYAFRNEWHHTGDLGRFDDEGYLWYVGRKPEKELIKTGGENVYPAEVETAILDHPAIDETCVIGVPDADWGEAIKAFCVLKQGQSLLADDLIEFVASKISRYKKPKFVEFVSALPKTSDGSVDREKVKAEFGQSNENE
jgi:long-chain acyl-CoA synthetase